MRSRLKNFLTEHHLIVFYSSWLLIQLIQSATTELLDDEAYYWMYSLFPSWGYFDHPPVISILISAGYALFPNELGVRLFPVIVTTASLYIIQLLLRKQNHALFYAICYSLAIAQIGGIMAVPDASLMFFVGLFFLQYKRFLENTSWLNTLLLALCISAMLYTKYQSILIICFTLMSNPRLLWNPRTYIAAFIAIMVFVPHILWQHANGYPSLHYHLFERNSPHYEIKHTVEYLIGQLLIAGPLAGWLLMYTAILYKPSDKLERALKFSLIGIYIFFLLTTLKGRVEANWTVVAFVGLIVLSHQYLTDNPSKKFLLYKLVPLTVVLVLAQRIIMMIDLPPAWWIFKDEFHGNKTFAEEIKSRAGNDPVVFIDSYQKPSKYTFYSGNDAMSLNTPRYRRNNFNFWPVEDSIIEKPAYVVWLHDTTYFSEQFKAARMKNLAGRKVEKFFSFSRVQITGVNISQLDSANLAINFSTTTPDHYLSYFQERHVDTCQLYLTIFKNNIANEYFPVNVGVKDITKNYQHFISTTRVNLPPGKYVARFSISSSIPCHPSLNSSGYTLKIK